MKQVPSKEIIKEIIEIYMEKAQSDNFDLIYKDEIDGDTFINTTILADSIQYDMKFDRKYNTV